MSDYVILAPVVLLLALGAFIALQSGAGSLPGPGRTDPDDSGLRLVAGNFSAMVLRLLGWVALLALVQGFVGFPLMMFR